MEDVFRPRWTHSVVVVVVVVVGVRTSLVGGGSRLMVFSRLKIESFFVSLPLLCFGKIDTRTYVQNLSFVLEFTITFLSLCYK